MSLKFGCGVGKGMIHVDNFCSSKSHILVVKCNRVCRTVTRLALFWPPSFVHPTKCRTLVSPLHISSLMFVTVGLISCLFGLFAYRCIMFLPQ